MMRLYKRDFLPGVICKTYVVVSAASGCNFGESSSSIGYKVLGVASIEVTKTFHWAIRRALLHNDKIMNIWRTNFMVPLDNRDCIIVYHNHLKPDPGIR